MSIQKRQMAIIFRRKVSLFNQKRESKYLEDLSLMDMVELIDIIPDVLIGIDNLSYACSIQMQTPFLSISGYLKWLQDISDIVYHRKYFNSKVLLPIDNSEVLLLSDFLIDDNEMINHPVAVLQEIRRIIVKLLDHLSTIDDGELKKYYQERFDKKLNPYIATVITTIAEYAGAN